MNSVDQLVTNGSDELEEHIDFYKAVLDLPADQQSYLTERFAGYSAAEAMYIAGVQGNSTRFHADAVRALVAAMNGVKHGV